jgi:hypothetical protein
MDSCFSFLSESEFFALLLLLASCTRTNYEPTSLGYNTGKDEHMKSVEYYNNCIRRYDITISLPAWTIGQQIDTLSCAHTHREANTSNERL